MTQPSPPKASSFFEPVEIDVAEGHHETTSAVGSASAVGSLANTITSTLVDGLAHTVAHWKVLLLGQAVSLVLAIAGGTSEVLSLECGVSAPSTFNAFGYLVVAIFGGCALRKEQRSLSEETIFRGDEIDNIAANGDGADENEDVDDEEDDLTMEDDSPAKRSFFSLRLNNTNDNNLHRNQRDKYRLDGSQGSNSKMRQQYPFLCGLFTINAPGYYYFLVAFIEAQAYYFIFLAFRYTSFTFVYMSDALAIPSAMLLTRTIMKKRYSWTHLIGSGVCVAGIVVNTVSDMNIKDSLEHVSSAEHIKGDLFAILGAVLLGLDDVLSEIIVTDYGGVTEMLFMKGFFGTLISVVQMAIFEIDSVYEFFGVKTGSCDISYRMTLFSTHIISRALDVAGEMQFLYLSEAALLNLSLLTSDLYAAIWDVIRIGLQLTPMYYLAFFLIFAGIVFYEAGPSPSERQAPSTPQDIEFRQRGQKYDLSKSIATEHAGNISHEGRRMEAELT